MKVTKSKTTKTTKTRKIQTKVPMLDLQGRFLPESVNEEKRTVEMVFTTSMAVRSFNWDYGVFNEILSMKEEHVRLERFKKGAPLLDSHDRYSGLSAQLGVVESVKIEGDKLVGTVRFSKRDEVEPVFQDVKDGIIRNGSIGYRVYKYQDESSSDDKIKTMLGVDWEPVEMSLVTVPADHNAQVREIDEPEEFLQEITIVNLNERTEEMPPKNENPAPAADSVREEKIRQEEREKNSKVLRACRRHKLPEAYAEELIDSGRSLLECMELISEKSADQDGSNTIVPAQSVKTEAGGLDETVTRREGAVEAILHRHAPKEHALSEKGFRFQGRSAMEILRMMLESSGIRTERMGQTELIQRGLHSTSDFPNILQDAASKRLQKGYESVEQVFRRFATEGTLKDFKPVNVAQLGEAPALLKLGEGGSIKTGTMGDSKEMYRLYTYARAMEITRETFINDDLGAFLKLAAAYGRSAAHMENTVAQGESLLNNPKMGDAQDLFHATHSNLRTAGAISESTISAMKAEMRKQKDDQGRQIGLSPKFLMVGPDQEDAARKLLAAQNANGGYNVHAGAFELLVEPLITNNDHYLIANPNQIEILEVSYLEGARGLQIETKDHPGKLGLIIRAYEDFGAKVINFRGLQKTPAA